MRAWLERSFRNRIFLTVLLVALVPLLLCDVLMTQVMIFRSEHTLRTDAQEEMALLTAQLDALLTDCGDVTRALAGSTLKYAHGLKNVHRLTGKPLSELVKATSWNQAQSLGLEGLGKIAPGFTADMVLLDDDFNTSRVFIDGVEKYSA